MITTVSTSGGAQVAVFALPTRTMYSGLRVSWLSYLGAAEQRRAAELPTPVGAVSYLSTQALMRSMAACRLGLPPARRTRSKWIVPAPYATAPSRTANPALKA
ncbi:phosphopantetheinyl transferase [Rothia aeria]|uniref:Phosphopantetheinyl transferase n=1 Tax=Rothia aeria TaxID=172042 RepID=A0A2Z5QVM6_9MICC|nr:phosphopantetheinyl transferase [Rothia aeria]